MLGSQCRAMLFHELIGFFESLERSSGDDKSPGQATTVREIGELYGMGRRTGRKADHRA
jgi:hypothetical protein